MKMTAYLKRRYAGATHCGADKVDDSERSSPFKICREGVPAQHCWRVSVQEADVGDSSAHKRSPMNHAD